MHVVTGVRIRGLRQEALRIIHPHAPQVDPVVEGGLDVEVDLDLPGRQDDGVIVLPGQRASLVQQGGALGSQSQSGLGAWPMLHLRQVER